jgi:F0F1-type ATP synthase membrane subunit b/b'
LRFGAPEGTRTTSAAAPAPPAPAAEKPASPSSVVDANAARMQAESDAQRLRSEAEAIKRQAETDLARARADAEAIRAARTKAEADTNVARLRAQAEADAARIRADAAADAARTKREAEVGARTAEIQAAKAKETQREADAKARDSAAAAPASLAADKSSHASSGSAARFDGMWNVTIVCQKHPDGASGYTLRFLAQVKDGLLRGVHGTEGTANSLILQGDIQPDGSAKLDAKGLTGDPKFNPKGTQSGVPYSYQVAAQFEGSRGTGRASLVRGCDLTFAKQ